MEQDIYKTMLELEEKFKYYNNTFDRNVEVDDVFYYGKVFAYEEVENTNRIVTNVLDVYIIVEDSNPPIYKFFDGDGNLIAINLNDGRGVLPTENFMWGKISKSEFEKMNDTPLKSEKSLNYTRKRIKEIAKELNVPEENILAIYEEAYQIDEEKDEKEEEKEDKKPKDIVRLEGQDKAEKNNTSMDAFTKQETSLDQIVNDGKTLREILNLPPEAQTLAFVETSSIVNDTGKADNTRFTPLYKDIDGNYHRIDELQMAGGNPNRSKVAAVNEQGDNVEYTSVYSMFTTKETSGTQYAITANIGSYGVIDLGIGQVDKTQGINSIENETAVVTTRLKTDSTYYTSRETRERINGERDGRRQATARRDEAKLHEKCEHNKDVKDVDGKLDNREEVTEHTLESYAIMLTNRLTAKIGENSLIRENYSYAELRNKIEKMLVENPDLVTSIENIDDTEVVVRETLNKELNDQEPVKTRWDTINRKTIA